MTKESKKEQSIELLNLLQEVKYEIETNTKSKITIRNNAKKTKIFVKIHGIYKTQKYLFAFRNGREYEELADAGREDETLMGLL